MERQYRFIVNGSTHDLMASPHETLLDTLRDRLGLTGAKEGCNEGECASCTVLLNGRPVNSCLVLVGDAAGKSVVTIEGLASRRAEAPGEIDNGDPHPVQKAFVSMGGIQCGYCTPGMILSAFALLGEQPNPTPDDIKFYLAGNICRCTGYNKIVAAVQAAARDMLATAESSPMRRLA
jgi:carbon-monoxide dehydrogenase small subunit